jgi:formate dehydrogenase maturation protein FdhE
MVQPASRDDLQLLFQAVEALDRRLAHATTATTKQLERLEQAVAAALEAIGDEKVESDSRYQSTLMKAIDEMREELKQAYDYIKNCLVEAEVDHQKMRRHLEDEKKK